MAHTFKAPVSVWIGPYSSYDAASLQQANDTRGMMILPDGDAGFDGYTQVGVGTVEINIATTDQITQAKVEAMRAELERDRVESFKRQNALIRKISELEALTYEAAR